MCEGPMRPRCLVCQNSFDVSKKSRKDADKLCPHCTDKGENPSQGRIAVCDVCDGYIVYRNCNGKKNSHWMHCPRLILDAEEKNKAAEEKNKAAEEKNKAAEEKNKAAEGNESILPSDSEYIRIACDVLRSGLSCRWKGAFSAMLYGARHLQHMQW